MEYLPSIFRSFRACCGFLFIKSIICFAIKKEKKKKEEERVEEKRKKENEDVPRREIRIKVKRREVRQKQSAKIVHKIFGSNESKIRLSKSTENAKKLLNAN